MKRLFQLILLLLPLLLSEKMFAQLNPKFSATPTSGCAPLSVQFNSEEDGYTHNWDFGNGPVVNNGPSDPTRHYTTPGTYTVTHTITGPGGPKSESKTITVFASPTVDFSASATTVCPGTTVTFTFTGSLGVTGNANYKWVFGNDATPNIASGQNMSTATAIYTTPGTYNVTLEVTNNKDCYNSITKKLYITVKENPTINFTASQTDFCTDTASVTFTPVITGGAPGPYIYSWDFGGPGNPSSNLASPTHTYPGPRPAQYTVKLTVQSSNGCSTSLTKNNYIRLHKPDASFTGPTEACVYTTVNFTNTSTPPGAGSTWNFGDGSGNQPGVHGSHIYTTAGTYPVRLETSIGGCVDTVTKTILIRAQPNPKIVTNPDSVCPAPQLVCYSTQPLMASYDWNIENENGISTHTTPSPCVLFGKNGCWPSLLRVVDSFGCKDTILHTLVIHELNIVSRINNKYTPYPGFADSGCVSFNAAFAVEVYKGDPALYPCTDTSRIYPYGIKKIKWKFGTGDSSTAQYPQYTYTDSGYYKITVEVETNNGCIVRDSMRIKVGYKPIIDSLVASDTVICPRSAVFFTGHVRGYDTLLFWWDFGDFKTRTRLRDSTFTHFYFGGPPCIDSHTVKLVASHKGCVSDTFKREKYIKMLPPCAEFEWDIDTCSKPLTVRFTNKSKGDSSWLWKFGDGNTSTIRNPIHTYATKGYYNVQLIVHNDSTNCYDTMTKRIFFGENAPDVIANKNTLCVGDSVDFWAYQTGDSSLAIFTWYIDSVQVAAHQDALTYIFTRPGLYTIMVTAYSLNTKCTDTVIKTDWITVGGPTAGFVTADSFVCNPATVQFTDTSYAGENTTISKRSWYFGTSANDTLTATGVTVSRVYATTGDFDVSLIITDNLGCKDTAYYPGYIHVLKPDAIFSAPSPTCVGQEISFTNASVNSVKNFWLFGDGNTDTVLNPKHTYTTMGVFNAQLIVTDSLGCKDTSNVVPITTTKPIANFTMSDSMAVCAPLIVSFDGRSSQRQKKYEWHFDDGASPGTKNTHTVVYNDVKEYQVKLIVTDSLGCKDSITKPIQVLGYAGAFSYTPTEGCVPLTVDFSSKIKGNIPTIIWDFGDGNSLLGSYQQPQVTYTYTQPGRYLPRMIFNNGLGCKTSSDGLDTILVDAAIADFETGPACQYSMVEFINKSVGVISPLTVTNWTFDDGTFSALNNPKRKYGPPGKYPVKLYVKNANGCEDSIDKELTINVPIEVSAGGDTIICLTDSAQLFPTGGVSYLWSPGATLSCTDCANPYAFPKVKTVYTVISTDINGCHDTGYAQVDIKTHVVSIVGNGGEICQGEVFDLNVSGARTYIWSPAANLDNYTSATPKASPWETTKYRVIAYEGSCIPDTSHVDLVVHPKPTVTVRGEQTIVAGTSADLLASGEYISRFLWSPAATLSCKDCSNPIASPFKTTTYTVKVFTKFDCVDSADVTITVLCDKSQLFIPNTFTPNGDGINDIFMVRGTGITTLQAFRVYNRWGQVMFERTNVSVNDKTFGWDGNFNGTQLPPDVYVWTVEAFCENGDLLKLKGDVTIIR